MRTALVLLAALTLVTAAEARSDYLWQCVAIGREDARHRCYTRLLLERVERSGDPARELPRIDRDVREQGGELVGACHALMHEVGRRYARAHGLTLERLKEAIPRSSDPTCSAGFGMGLVMHLGPELARTGGKQALAGCHRLPTRFRAYTCIHGLGHALMRGYHGQIARAARACRTLGPHGVDCAQGVFHDYWISLRGADGTTRPRRGAPTSPRVVCDGRHGCVRPGGSRDCLERRCPPPLATAADVDHACRGLRPLQRLGCIGGASVAVSTNPFVQTSVCARLADTAEADACLRGVAVPALTDSKPAQRRLLRACAGFRKPADCYAWFGRTLALVTEGRFDCGLADRPGRAACRAGRARVAEPLVTFA